MKKGCIPAALNLDKRLKNMDLEVHTAALKPGLPGLSNLNGWASFMDFLEVHTAHAAAHATWHTAAHAAARIFLRSISNHGLSGDQE